MSESRAAIQKLHSDLIELGVNGAYELGDDARLCVWISLVVVYRDGYFRWWEGASRVATREMIRVGAPSGSPGGTPG